MNIYIIFILLILSLVCVYFMDYDTINIKKYEMLNTLNHPNGNSSNENPPNGCSCRFSDFHNRKNRDPPEKMTFCESNMCGSDAISVAPKRDRYYQPKQGVLGEDILSGYPFLHYAI